MNGIDGIASEDITIALGEMQMQGDVPSERVQSPLVQPGSRAMSCVCHIPR